MIPEGKKRITITLSKEIEKKLDKISNEFGMNKSAIITMLINQYVTINK